MTDWMRMFFSLYMFPFILLLSRLMTVKKLHLISDIHIEFFKSVGTAQQLGDIHPDLFRNCANPIEGGCKDTILLLPGDIGYPYKKQYWDILDDFASKYHSVLFTAGNHEYYNGDRSRIYTMEEIDEITRARTSELFKKHGNVFYLDRDAVEIDNFTFLGTALWSNVDEGNKVAVGSMLNDYHCIYTRAGDGNPKLVTTDFTTAIHRKDVEWLEAAIKAVPENRDLVVLTHHLPSYACIDPQYRNPPHDSLNAGFASHLERTGVFSDKIKLWVFGHTHCPVNTHVPGYRTKFISNPAGYVFGRRENPYVSMLEIDILALK